MEQINNVEQLPCRLQLRQVCTLQFRTTDNPITATVIGIHFHKEVVKFDLELCFESEEGEERTRIYNVHLKYLNDL